MNIIPSYSAEQLSLNMIVWFLVVISGMLFGIFFYMMNVQKIGLYGILKAIGVKTSKLFQMMWTQMLIITSIALVLSIGLSQLRSEEHTSELQSRGHLVCRRLLDKTNLHRTSCTAGHDSRRA